MTLQRKRNFETRKNLIVAALAIGFLGFFIVPALVQAQSYVEPEGPPPQSVPDRTVGIGNDAPLEFLNASTAQQQKLGSLLIGERDGVLAECTSSDTSGCPALCLNPDSALWTNDTANCIRTWTGLAAVAGGPFVRLLAETELGEIDRGFFAVAGSTTNFQPGAPRNQFYSVISKARSGAVGASGVRSDSTTTSHYAGQFFGTVVVQPESGLSELCLNGTSGLSCISDWNDAGGSLPDGTLKLQSGIYTTPQAGNIGLSGPLLVGSLVTGQPAPGTPINFSCGDGICSSENGETTGNCAADCS